jgi:hypothetical protein
MALVKVYNDSHVDYKGTFRDSPIEIPAREYIEMGRAEAVKFLGEYSSVIVDGAGRHKMPKKLRMAEDPEEKAERYNQPLRFTAFDGSKFRTTQGLQDYEAKLQTESKEVEDAKPKRRRTVPKVTT